VLYLAINHTSFISDAHKAVFFPQSFQSGCQDLYNSSYWALERSH